MLTQYLPRLQEKFPRPDAGRRLSWSAEEEVYEQYYTWQPHFPAAYEDLYPGHLHIDLMPRARGKGQGRALVETMLDSLLAAGAAGVHLEMARSNTHAYGFYKRIGFHELGRLGEDLWMGIRPSRVPITTALRKPLSPRDFVTGVVEGFYGAPWSSEQRTELLHRMGRWGMGVYLYAPKDDAKHRALWREPYTDSEADRLRVLIEVCHAQGLRFAYGIAPGLDLRYNDDSDQLALFRKVEQVLRLGATSVAVLLDDVPEQLSSADEAAFGSVASAQCAAANALVMSVLSLARQGQVSLLCPSSTPPSATAAAAAAEGKTGNATAIVDPWSFLICPTQYCSALCPGGKPVQSAYLQTMGRELLPEYVALWTGPDVISQAIPPQHILRVSRTLQRRLVIWDNLHANDYDNGRRVFLGPYGPGRDADDLPSICHGILCNPNCEFEANFVPLRTLSLFGRHTHWAGALDDLPEVYLHAIEAPPTADIVSSATLSAPERVAGGFDVRSAFKTAVAEWHAECWVTSSSGGEAEGKEGAAPLHLDDLILVCDAFYLPYQIGPRAALLLSCLRHALVATDFDGRVTGLPPQQVHARVAGKALDPVDWKYTTHFPDAPDLNSPPEVPGAVFMSPGSAEATRRGSRPCMEWLAEIGASPSRPAHSQGCASAADVQLSIRVHQQDTHDLAPLTSPSLKSARSAQPAASAVKQAKCMCEAVGRVFEASTRLKRRSLAYSLYRFLWDAKERGEAAVEYLAWAQSRQAAALRTPAAPAPLPPPRPRHSPVMESKWHKAGPIGGGFIAAFDSMLFFDARQGGFSAARLVVPHTQSPDVQG